LSAPVIGLDVVVFGLGYVDDDVGVQQGLREGNRPQHSALRHGNRAVGNPVAAEIDQLRAVLFGHRGHSGHPHAFNGRQQLAAGFGHWTRAAPASRAS